MPSASPRLWASTSSRLVGPTGSPSSRLLRSPPALKARSPAPVRIPTSASSSSRKRPQASTSSRWVRAPIAFIRSGRSIVITAAGPRRS